MHKSIKSILAATACAALLTGGAFAETAWKPPAEIAPTTAGATPADAATPAAATPTAPASKVDKEKSCNEQVAAKGLKGKAKRQAKAECLKS